LKKRNFANRLISTALAACILTGQAASGVTYTEKPGRIEIKINESDLLAAAAPATEKIVRDFVKELENNAAFQKHIEESPGADSVSKTLASDQRILDDMRSELAFWQGVDSVSKTFGVAALAGFSVVAARELEKTGLPMARAAAMVALVTAVVAEGSAQAIAGKKAGLESRIKDLRESLDTQANYLYWQADFGGEGSPPPVPVKCLIKETCRGAEVCITNRHGIEDCEEKPVCASEILTCRD
jgi:hypothetical protein